VIVANTNLIGYLLLPGPLRDVATQIFLRDRAWHAPLLWRSEFANTLLGFVRRGDFDLETALDLRNEAMLLMENMEHAVNGAQVMRLALLSGCTAYDCEPRLGGMAERAARNRRSAGVARLPGPCCFAFGFYRRQSLIDSRARRDQQPVHRPARRGWSVPYATYGVSRNPSQPPPPDDEFRFALPILQRQRRETDGRMWFTR
jgi:hypothetical protein